MSTRDASAQHIARIADETENEALGVGEQRFDVLATFVDQTP